VKALIIGGGGREHSIAAALKRGGVTLYACMKNKNPGIARLSEEFALVKETEIDSIVKYAISKKVDLAVIGPEAPLEAGLADALRNSGIAVVGPSKEAAKIETSKQFMRELMKKHSLPGQIQFLASDSLDEITNWLDSNGLNVVVKPTGLTGGKGAKVFGEHLQSMEDVKRYCREILEKQIGGSGVVILEERMEGEEFTLQAFCDGNTIIPCPAVQDHKRAFEGDSGPNTGGMGSYSDCDHLLPFLPKEDCEQAIEIMKKVNEAMRYEGLDYRGILYGQFMLTKTGPKIVEFNARFGDPEAMNVLPIMTDSFVDIAEEIAAGSLSGNCGFAPQATVCKYVVPEGYGTKSLVGQRIEVNEERIRQGGAILYYAAVNETEEGIFTTNSRSIGIVGTGSSIEEAERSCEDALAHVSGRVFVRHDIGKWELIRKRIEHMKTLRGAISA